MGAVFRARNPRFPGHVFAVKVLAGPGRPTSESLARFERELQALARVGGHPNIVRVLGGGSDGGQPYYVMEHVQGASLGRLVADGGPLDPRRAAALVREVAS